MAEISVIVPVYKAEAYLHDCVQSILKQTFRAFELILVEDGSPDGSGAICDDYAARYSCVTALHQTNQGQAAARNHGMRIAKGRWICFVDSDDLIHPQTLQLLYDGAVSADAGICQCRLVEAPELTADFFLPAVAETQVLELDEKTLLQLLDADEYPGWIACAKLIRRELIEGYPFREGRVYEDNEAVCRWLLAGKRLVSLANPLYFYRTNPESTTKKTFSLKRLDYLWALESIIGFYTQAGYLTVRQRFVDRYVQAAINSYEAVLYVLGDEEKAGDVRTLTVKTIRRNRMELTLEQKEQLMNAMYPGVSRIYWPVKGGLRRLREEGISGLLRRLKQRRGDSQ